MKNNLMIFEKKELEILTKEDVDFEFEGVVLFNGKQIGEILGYKRGVKAINDITRENQRFKISNSKILNQDFRKLHNTGEIFINEKGVMKLIINSDMPKADEFEDRVWGIVTKVQQTGKFDSIENKINKIQDEKERELTLGLYSLEQALKVNQNDLSLPIMINQKKLELNNYKQQEQLKQLNNKIIEIENKSNEQENRLNNMLSICDRVQFTNEVNRISRLTGKQQSEIYNLAYIKLKDMYGIDLNTRVRNRREQIQDKRLSKDKKPYAPSTLKSKINNLVLADELNIWNELGNSLNAVNNELNLN